MSRVIKQDRPEGETALAFHLRSIADGLNAYIGDDAAYDDTPNSYMSPLEWAEQYRYLEGRPFSLDLKEIQGRLVGFEPLKQIYNDPHPFIIIQKGAQKGVTEMAISIAIHALDIGDRYYKTGKRGLNVGYMFPTDKALSAFSKERMSSLMDETPHLSQLFTGTGRRRGYDDVTFKQARHSYLYLRGMYSGSDKGQMSALKSFPADFLFLDEYDEMRKKQIALVEKRLLGSTHVNRRLYLSTPTYSNQGINKLYLQSDRMVWESLCPHCHVYTQLDFFRDVFCNGVPYDDWKDFDSETLFMGFFTVHCPSCSKAIPDTDRYTKGRWRAEQPEIKSIRGYLIPSLCFPSTRLNQTAANITSDDPEKVEEGYRSDLGIPYDLSGDRVTLQMLLMLATPLENGILPSCNWGSVTLGLDVGRRLFYRLSGNGPGGKRYLIGMGTLKSDDPGMPGAKTMWQKASDLIKTYRVKRCVVDNAPEYDTCMLWQKKHRAIVFRATYPDGKKAMEGDLFRFKASDDEKKKAKREGRKPIDEIIQINRTAAMDAVLAVIKGGKEIWPLEFAQDRTISAHLCAPVREIVEDDAGNKRASWEHKAPDDFFHACVYDYMAYTTLPKPAGAWNPGSGSGGWGVKK